VINNFFLKYAEELRIFILSGEKQNYRVLQINDAERRDK
jgi:hypothetical protein